jgi:hypothetical protein
LVAELREREKFPLLETLVDACDPVPVVALPEQVKPSVYLSDLQPGDGSGPDEVVEVPVVDTLGDDPEDPPRDVTLAVRFRHCTCVNLFGERLPQGECLGETGQCDWDASDGLWTYPTVSDDLGSSGLSPHDFLRGSPSRQLLTWRWKSDAEAGLVKGSCLNSECETYGILHSEAVRGSETPVSARDGAYNLRESFQLYETPFFNLKNPADDVPGFSQPCQFGNCGLWFRPDLLTNPYDFTSHFEQPSRIRVLPGGLGAALSGVEAVWVELGSNLATTLAQETVVVTPAEPGAALLGRGVTTLGVVLPQALAFGVGPTEVVVRDGALTSRVADEGGVTPPSALNSGGLSGPSVRKEYQATFSATQGAVYVLGGLEGSAPVWRYQTGSRSWDRLIPRGVQPTSQVLSSVVDAQRHTLYALDVSKTGWFRQVRLLGIDTQTGEGSILARWPRLGIFRSVHLGLLSDGSLAVVAGTRRRYSVWRLKAEDDRVRVAGFMTGRGEVFDRPFPSLHDLVLPVLRRGSVDLVPIGVEALKKEFRPCLGL